MTSRLPIIGQALAKAKPIRRILKVTHQGQNRGRSLMSTIALFNKVTVGATRVCMASQLELTQTSSL